ncbi:MAG: acyl carrier protein [Bryobacterales bacterium]
MTLDDLKTEIADIVEVEPAELSDDTSSENLASWDSMATLRIISFLDEQLDDQVEPEEAQALTTFGAIVEFARKRGIIDAG